MVYEIYFEPKGAVWRIRITVFYLYFFAVSRVVQESADLSMAKVAVKMKPMSFTTFEEAERYSRRVGLDKAYQRRERMKDYLTQVNGVLAHGSSAS